MLAPTVREPRILASTCRIRDFWPSEDAKSRLDSPKSELRVVEQEALLVMLTASVSGLISGVGVTVLVMDAAEEEGAWPRRVEDVDVVTTVDCSQAKMRFNRVFSVGKGWLTV
jgi:hypothetical protein